MQVPDSQSSPAKTRTFFVFAAWGIVIAPLTIVLHELGHYLAGLLMGTPDLALHYGSVSDTAAERGFPPVKIGIQALAGPAVTLGIMTVCVFALRKNPDHPVWLTAMFAAPVRFAVGAVYLYFAAMAAIQGIPPGQPNFDEFKAAQMLGFSVVPILIAELALTVALWSWAVGRLGKGIRFPALAGTAVGIISGIGLWIALLGPLLLP